MGPTISRGRHAEMFETPHAAAWKIDAQREAQAAVHPPDAASGRAHVAAAPATGRWRVVKMTISPCSVWTVSRAEGKASRRRASGSAWGAERLFHA